MYTGFFKSASINIVITEPAANATKYIGQLPTTGNTNKPPIGIALATTFFKNRFSKSERQSGITNYVMGLAFITEGAIPIGGTIPPTITAAIIS